jgi:signal peptidase I
VEDKSTAQSNNKTKAISKLIVLVVIVYLATYASLYGLRFVLGTEYPVVVVEGISMQPTYYEGDLLLLRGIPKIDIKIGDVVVYRRSTSSLLIVHRVVAERWRNDELYFTTKGDNNLSNPFPDAEIQASYVIGVVSFHVPKLGSAVLALQSPMGLVFSGGLIVVILLLDVFNEQKQKSETPSGSAPYKAL